MAKKKDTGISNIESDGTVVVHDSEKFIEHLQNVREMVHQAVPEPSLKWKKVKLNGDTLHVVYTERMDGGIIFETDRKCNALVHNDLRNALGAMAKHLALICDTSEAVKIQSEMNVNSIELEQVDAEITSNIKVTGFSLAGDDDQEGIVIIGQKRIGNKVLNLISPFMKWDEDEYEYMTDLRIDVDTVCSEANEYMFNSKVAAVQLDLPFDEDPAQIEE